MKAVFLLLIVSFYAYAFEIPQYYNFGVGNRASGGADVNPVQQEDSSASASFSGASSNSGISHFKIGVPSGSDSSGSQFSGQGIASPNSENGISHFQVRDSSSSGASNTANNGGASEGIASPNSASGIDHFKVGAPSAFAAPNTNSGVSQFDQSSSEAIAAPNSGNGIAQFNAAYPGVSGTPNLGSAVGHLSVGASSGAVSQNSESGNTIGAEGTLKQEEAKAEPIKILRYDSTNEEDGHYSFNVETADGIVRSESGSPGENGVVNQEGSISFTFPGGETFDLKFVADENGYQPQSDSLPKAPDFPHEIPQYVIDQIEKAKLEDEQGALTESSVQQY